MLYGIMATTVLIVYIISQEQDRIDTFILLSKVILHLNANTFGTYKEWGDCSHTLCDCLHVTVYVANIGVAKTQLDNVHLPYPGRPAMFIWSKE